MGVGNMEERKDNTIKGLLALLVVLMVIILILVIVLVSFLYPVFRVYEIMWYELNNPYYPYGTWIL
jgi:hypothetical protein